MIRRLKHSRRSFIKLCMGAITASQMRQSLAQSDNCVKQYNKVNLVGFNKQPLVSASIEVGRSYIFHYPYVSTPCFLIDLGEPVDDAVKLKTEDGRLYTWHGGVGRANSIVAFSAICAHKMTHPAKSVSFINYRHQTINYNDKNNKQKTGAQLIYCCSERSVYDVKFGARVVGGPAGQPLTAILLEYDKKLDQLYAVGVSGGEMYDRFFKVFSARLQLEYRITEVDKLVNKDSEVMLLEKFSKVAQTC